MSTYQTGVMWPIAGGIVQLAVPTGYAPHSRAIPLAISSDGSVIVGSVVDALTNIAAPCRWDSAGTVCTELLALVGIERAVACSSDASVIYGGDFGTTLVCRWTSGGTAGALMSPLGGDTSAQFTDLPIAICSTDGSIAVGVSYPSSTPTVWTAGVGSALGGGGTYVGACSDNGLIVSGSIASQPPVYWTSGTQRTLASVGVDSYAVYGVNGAGTIIHGRDNNTNTNVWWDGLGTNVGPVYGTLHTSSNSPPLSTAFANSKTNNVVVGTVDDSGTPKAARWVAGTETVLPLLGAWESSSGVCVSGDGTIKGGQAGLTTNPIAAYWDASDAAFMLPENTAGLTPPERNSIMTGVSRDGSVFFGQAIYFYFVPPTDGDSTIAELWFSPTAFFVDLSVESNRRKFIAVDGGARNLGLTGQNPFGLSPPVFLTRRGPPATFATNNGRGAPFDVVGDALEPGETNPPGSTTITTTVQPNSPGQGVLGDYLTGNLYAFNPETLTDNGTRRRWLRRWRALPKTVVTSVRFSWLNVLMQTGINVPEGTRPQVVLRWSDDGGFTFSDERIVAVGAKGQTRISVKFNRLGMTRRFSGSDRVFELSSTDPFGIAILDAEVEAS